MYSLRSNALLNTPQASSESGACGSSSAITSRAFGCAIGTNSAPAARSRVSGFHSPASVRRWWPSVDCALNVGLVGAEGLRRRRRLRRGSARNATPCGAASPRPGAHTRPARGSRPRRRDDGVGQHVVAQRQRPDLRLRSRRSASSARRRLPTACACTRSRGIRWCARPVAGLVVSGTGWPPSLAARASAPRAIASHSSPCAAICASTATIVLRVMRTRVG